MKVILNKPKGNKRRVVVELDEGEEFISIRQNAHYKLGSPVEDIVASHVLTATHEVTWCSAGQEWVP